MKINKPLLFVIIIIGISACATSVRINISSEYQKDTDISKYKTYQLMKDQDAFSFGMNSINQGYIEKAIQREMMVLGYDITSEPDFLVSYFVKEQLVQEAEYNYRGYYNKWGFPLWKNVLEYEEGTLIVDLIDQSSQQIIWHGAIEGEVFDKAADAEEKINKNVQALFERFNEDTRQAQEISTID